MKILNLQKFLPPFYIVTIKDTEGQLLTFVPSNLRAPYPTYVFSPQDLVRYSLDDIKTLRRLIRTQPNSYWDQTMQGSESGPKVTMVRKTLAFKRVTYSTSLMKG